MANNQFINLEELSKTTQALLSKINEQSNLKVNKDNVRQIVTSGTKIAEIEDTEIYAPEIDTSNFITEDDLNLANVAYSGSYNDLRNKPSLATVATSGSYNDLSNKPEDKLGIGYLYSSSELYVPKGTKMDTSNLGTNSSTFLFFSMDDFDIPANTYIYIKDLVSGGVKGSRKITFYNAPDSDDSQTISAYRLRTSIFSNIRDSQSSSQVSTAISNALNNIATPTTETMAASKSYVDSTIGTAIGNVNSFNVNIVSGDLPTTDIDTHTIYFKSNSSSGNNVYDEYMYINNNWELISSTAIDLSNYVEKYKGINNDARQTHIDTSIDPFSSVTQIQLEAEDHTDSSNHKYSNLVVGTSSGIIMASTEGVSIYNVVTPTDDAMATNKKYVDDSISAISIPTKVSDLTNDSGYLTSYTETDPIFTASAAAGISSTDISNCEMLCKSHNAAKGNR